MANICDLNNKKPNIIYPIHWEYKVIVETNSNIDEVVSQILKGYEHKISSSKASKEGKYKSYNVAVLVFSEKERLKIFSELKQSAKYVL